MKEIVYGHSFVSVLRDHLRHSNVSSHPLLPSKIAKFLQIDSVIQSLDLIEHRGLKVMHLSLPLQDIRASNLDFIIIDAGSDDLLYHEPLHVV